MSIFYRHINMSPGPLPACTYDACLLAPCLVCPSQAEDKRLSLPLSPHQFPRRLLASLLPPESVQTTYFRSVGSYKCSHTPTK